MRRVLFILLFATCAALSAPKAGAADCTGNVLFDEPFNELDASWGPASEGKATLKPGINNFYWAWNTAFSLPEGELCADVTQASDTEDPRLRPPA